MPERVLFRCDADKQNGFGHFSRCLNLARGIKELKDDIDVTFLGKYNDLAAELLNRFEFKRADLPDDWRQQLQYAQDFDYFILDNYLVDQGYIDHFCHQPFKFIKIDDFYDLNLDQMDLVINFRFNIEPDVYKAKKSCVGVGYFPVRKEFRDLREANMASFRDEIKNILVFIGGTDRNQIGHEVVKMLDEIFKGVHITLVAGQDLKKEMPLSNNQGSQWPMSYDIDEHFKDADLIITGGGLTKYECAFCCVPNAALSQTAGQAQDTGVFARNGLAYDLGMAEDLKKNRRDLVEKMRDFSSPAVRRSIYESTKREFTTDSTKNIAEEIINL